MNHCIMVLVLAMSLWLVTPIAHAQDSLERGLLRQAPNLIKHCKDHGYKNVGVLKFRVAREGQEGLTDNGGTINLLTARRLELALILSNDPRNPVGIIDNASKVASTIAGASHLSAEGREKLFTGQYPLAWGKDTVQADAFFTGTIMISKNLRKLTLSLYCCDRANNTLERLGDDFQVANATDRLAEMGESFVLRGVFDEGKTETTKAKAHEQVYQEAIKAKEPNKHPAQQVDQPVTLEVLYDSKPVPYEFRDGKAYIPEPRQGQTIQFGLRRDAGKERYGVVLKVNGENTLDKQRQPELSCRKWVLGPGEGPWIISGYQIGTDQRENFRVASVAESREREISYGPDVGTITLTVFRDQKGKPGPVDLSEEAQYETVVKKVTVLPTRPANYNALKAQFLEDANRSLIVAGKRESSKVQTLSFSPDPNPVMSITIVYYHKR